MKYKYYLVYSEYDYSYEDSYLIEVTDKNKEVIYFDTVEQAVEFKKTATPNMINQLHYHELFNTEGGTYNTCMDTCYLIVKLDDKE